MNKINHFIDNIDDISDIRKTFYKTMLQKRYELILTPAYERAVEIEKSINNDIDEIDLD